MCNNNGNCRKFDAVMCPSYQVTGDEKDVTRGRANSLRLALSGQLGPDALASDEMKETLDLCVACKACRRECPTGVDMARMKIEFLHQWHARHRISTREKLTAYLPRYARMASRFAPLLNLRNSVPFLAGLGEKLTGVSAKRKLPYWRRDIYRPPRGSVPSPSRAAGSTASSAPSPSTTANSVLSPSTTPSSVLSPSTTPSSVLSPSTTPSSVLSPSTTPSSGLSPSATPSKEALLFVDCFARYFEPENARATRAVLEAGGYTVIEDTSRRPLCCGRTFLSAGLVEQAREEMLRLLAALAPYVERGAPIVGIEPSCLLTLRDELLVVVKGNAARSVAKQSLLLEELLAAEARRGSLKLTFRDDGKREAYLHGHCHQKALGTMPDVVAVLQLVPGLSVNVMESSCCGMAGAFGYEANHFDVSMRMAERNLLPAVRSAPPNALIVADGTSCRHQIDHGANRKAVHVARVLESALAN
jgi:Fe-S oxidoreductase